MKKAISLFISIFVFLTSFDAAFGAGVSPDMSEYTRLFVSRHAVPKADSHKVEFLKYLGLFKGTENGPELDRGLTRMEALVTVVRLLGAEEEALAQDRESGFADVPEWAAAYAGYGRETGLARGVSAERFGAGDSITAKQYATMLLRLLGYDDGAGAFSYDEALDFAHEAGLLDEWETAYYKERDAAGYAFSRGDAVCFLYDALYAPAPPESGGTSVIAKLYKEGRIDGEKAAFSMLERGESETEILRALENGYSEVLLSAATKALSENEFIFSDVVRDTFKNSLYNWSKEAGSAKGAALFAHNARNIKVDIVSSENDAMFLSNPEVAAYFSHPNKIVVRRDQVAGSVESALTHEFRHAMSSDIGLTALEEGVTEFWSQEVDGGYYGYPYYFVNLGKLLFHLAGAKAVNEGDLTGDYEDLLYALEKESGVDIDNIEFYSLLSAVNPSIEKSIANPDEDFFKKLDAVNEVFFSLVRGYYLNNLEERAEESANHEAFVDGLSALGQLLYHPSAMIREADSNAVKESPSSHYGEEFLNFVNEAISGYCEVSGADEAVVRGYFEESKDRRFCLEYLGKNAGVMFVKKGTGHRVTYRSEGNLYYIDFGSKADADKFAVAVDAVGVREVEGAGFVPRAYD
ncbi:MAG: hypothetical protein LBP30_03845 [Clostridiales Family XIII bacterium]|nr:hypothetical protein [Clostridiales Family XIII bacterium]